MELEQKLNSGTGAETVQGLPPLLLSDQVYPACYRHTGNLTCLMELEQKLNSLPLPLLIRSTQLFTQTQKQYYLLHGIGTETEQSLPPLLSDQDHTVFLCRHSGNLTYLM